MEKMRMTSPDTAAMNRARLAALADLFPGCITETRDASGRLKQAVNMETLQSLLTGLAAEGPEAYTFTWVGKRAAMAEAARPIRKTLRPLTPPSEDWEHTENLYIEGDNLDALKLLQESYLGKVKMIYIDPPYNTGHDFIYKDKFRMNEEDYAAQTELFDEEGNKQFAENNDSNPRFHSDWCSMMYPRLLLARNLLTDDGVIFISIDENEQATLKEMCNEIFGEANFLTCVTRATGTPTGGGFDGFVNEIDYMLIYAKSISFAKINGLPMSEEDAQIYDRIDSNGRYLIRPLRRTGGEDRKEDRPTMYYPLTAPDGTKVYPIGPTGYASRWICSPETAQKLSDSGLLEWKKVHKGNTEIWQVYQKFYLNNRTKTPGNLWTDIEGNKKATRDLRLLFDGEKIFDFPKPIGFLIKAIKIGCHPNSIILDFFSGSATTAHAVMQLNAEDGGHRKFIMVQAPEPCAEKSEAYKAGYRTICDIGEERIRRAGKKIRQEHSDVELDTGFRVFRVDSTNMEDVYYSAGDYAQEALAGLTSNIKPDRSALDVFFGCVLDWGLPLDRPYETEEIAGYAVHNYDHGALLACFADAVSEELVRAMAQRRPLRAVFRDSSFPDSPAKINAEEIFKMYSPLTKIKVI